jgi:DNA-directed RNA polymerase subunit H (RpoH/RPB5)
MSLAAQVTKSMLTLCEMMDDRGDLVVKEKLQQFLGGQIESLVSNKTIFTVDAGTHRVLYALASKFKASDIKKYLDGEVEMTSVESIIIIVREKISSTNLKTLEDIKNVQVFELRELLFNISKHSLVPCHELIGTSLNEELIQEIIDKHNVKSRFQLPIILKTDPMARYLNAKPGNIIKITRYSPTSGEHIVYRCCM